MQVFGSNNKNTISNTTLNYHWDFNTSIFLKSINLKIPYLTAPLNSVSKKNYPNCAHTSVSW